MIYKTRSITLKDGRGAILRAPRESDAEEMLEYLRTASGETDFLASYPEELKFTAEGERAYLENNLDSPNTMMLVCEVDGKIAGNSQIVFMSSLKTRHRAAVMIGLLREYWGLGIGSALFREMGREAREHGTAQLELEMIEGNDRALALYRSAGFETMAEHPDAFRLRDGTSRAAVFMRKVLK